MIFMVMAMIVCVIMPVLCVGSYYLPFYWPRLFSSALDPSTIAELCTVLEISSNDPRCNNGPVYAFQFFPEFRKHYKRGTPRQVVDQEIGAYFVGCVVHHTFSDGGYTACYYDFKGDGVNKVEVNYAYLYSLVRDVAPERRLEEAIWKTCTPAVGELPNNGITRKVCN